MKSDILKDLIAEAVQLEKQMEQASQEIQRISNNRDLIAKNLGAIRTAIAHFEKKGGKQPTTDSTNPVFDLSGKTILEAAKILLSKSVHGLKTKEIVEAMAKGGRPIQGGFATTVVGGALRRKPDIFRMVNEKWVVNKQPESS